MSTQGDVIFGDAQNGARPGTYIRSSTTARGNVGNTTDGHRQLWAVFNKARAEDKMSEDLAKSADFRSQVNEKLLRALIALLAIKDEHLLEELSIIFAHARKQGGEIGITPPGVWAGVNTQLGVLFDLALGEDEDEIEMEVVAHLSTANAIH